MPKKVVALSYIEKQRTTALIVTTQQNYSDVEYDPDIEPPYDPDEVDTAADMTNPEEDEDDTGTSDNEY